MIRKKLPPTHPGELLRNEIMPAAKLTQDKLANLLGVSRPTVNEIVTEKRRVSADMARRLARAFNTTPELWLGLQGEANPPESLLAQLRASNLHVQRGSFFHPELWSKGAWHSVIRKLERIDERTFLVHGVFYENNGLSAAGEDYTVVKRDGQWIVERVVGRWVA